MSCGLGLRADMYVDNIRDIPLAYLHEQGIRTLLFDLDNTITVWRGMEVDPAVVEWFSSLRQQFTVCIVSNGYTHRVEPIGRMLGVEWIAQAGKPHRRSFFAACKRLNAAPEQTAMIGDQLLTDVFGANRAGLYTIKCKLIDKNEFWGTRHISRPLERLINVFCPPKNRS